MEVLLREIGENSPASQRGRTAIHRLNAIHAQYADIADTDMAYVLSLFMTEPAWYCAQGFGWRPLHAVELAAEYTNWMRVGQEMGIRTCETWRSFEDAMAWARNYERVHMRYHPANERVMRATLGYYSNVLPAALGGVMAPVMSAYLEAYYPAQRIALGLPTPPTWHTLSIRGALWV